MYLLKLPTQNNFLNFRQAFTTSKLIQLHNVYRKMLYLPNYTYHRWDQIMPERHWCQKGEWNLSWRRTILTNVNSVWTVGSGLLCSGSRILP